MLQKKLKTYGKGVKLLSNSEMANLQSIKTLAFGPSSLKMLGKKLGNKQYSTEKNATIPASTAELEKPPTSLLTGKLSTSKKTSREQLKEKSMRSK